MTKFTKEEFKGAGIGWFKSLLDKDFNEGELVYVAETPQTHGHNGFTKTVLGRIFIKRKMMDGKAF